MSEIGLSVKRLQVRHHKAIDAELVPLGTSLVQWDALRHLDENPGASLHRLAELTFQSDQAFGTLAGRLIEARPHRTSARAGASRAPPPDRQGPQAA